MSTMSLALWAVPGLGILAAIVVRLFRRSSRKTDKSDKLDVGAVSEQWIVSHRTGPDRHQ